MPFLSKYHKGTWSTDTNQGKSLIVVINLIISWCIKLLLREELLHLFDIGTMRANFLIQKVDKKLDRCSSIDENRLDCKCDTCHSFCDSIT